MSMENELKQEVRSALKLHSVYISKASYDGGNIPLDKVAEPSDNFECGFKCAFYFPKDLSAQVELGCRIKTPVSEKELILYVCGDFSYGQELADDSNKLERVLRINAVSILFPYLRTYVSNFSSMTDMGLFQIPLLNITNLFPAPERNKELVSKG